MDNSKLRVRYRIWIDIDNTTILGPGSYEILKAIEETGSIAGAARKLGYSYKFIWTYVKRIEDSLGLPIVESRRGGRERGATELTELGKTLLEMYETLSNEVGRLVEEWEKRITQFINEYKSRGGATYYRE